MDIAAANGRSVVVSGDESAVLDVVAHWRDRGRESSRLRVSHAFHSARMEPMLDAFAAVARGITYSPPVLPLVTAVADRPATAEELCSPGHWVDHVRRPVRFADSVRYLRERGATHYVELGPDSVLAAMAQDCLSGLAHSPAPAPLVVPTLRGPRPETEALLTTLAALHAHGVGVDWHAVFAGRGALRTALPTYAFQRGRYWLDADRPQATAEPGSAPHPFLRSATSTADDDGLLLSGVLSLRDQPWLAAHLEERWSRAAPETPGDASGAMGGATDGATGGAPEGTSARASAGAPASTGEAADSLSALFRTACAVGKAWDGMALLTIASRFREVFDSAEALGTPPPAVTVATGGAGPRLICFPALSALSGPHEYTRFGLDLQGLRPVSVLPNPGFRPREALPATLEAFVSAQAAAVLACADGEPFALLGRSAGGWVAHAVAEHLERAGVNPSAVVLIDTFPGDSGIGTNGSALSAMTAGMLEKAAQFASAETDRLTAMAGYLDLYSGWKPAALSAPTLFVRARDHLPGIEAAGPWGLPHCEVTVPGDHFTVLEEHARTTALAVHSWLRDRP